MFGVGHQANVAQQSTAKGTLGLLRNDDSVYLALLAAVFCYTAFSLLDSVIGGAFWKHSLEADSDGLGSGPWSTGESDRLARLCSRVGPTHLIGRTRMVLCLDACQLLGMLRTGESLIDVLDLLLP